MVWYPYLYTYMIHLTFWPVHIGHKAQLCCSYTVMKTDFHHCRTKKLSCKYLRSLTYPRLRLQFDQHPQKCLWVTKLWTANKRSQLLQACKLRSKNWGWRWSCFRPDMCKHCSSVTHFQTSETTSVILNKTLFVCEHWSTCRKWLIWYANPEHSVGNRSVQWKNKDKPFISSMSDSKVEESFCVLDQLFFLTHF